MLLKIRDGMEKKTQKETQLYLEITLIIQVNKIQTDKNEIVFKSILDFRPRWRRE